MYVKLLLGVLVLLAAGIVFALARPRPPGVAGAALAPDPLDSNVPDVHLKDVPLSEAVDTLARLTRTNIRVNWDQLAAFGYRPGTAVELDLHDVTLLAALRVLFERDETPDRPTLAYDADGGVISIADAEKTPARLVVRVYDVRDLVSDEYFGRPPRPADGGVGVPAEDRVGNLAAAVRRYIGQPEPGGQSGGLFGSSGRAWPVPAGSGALANPNVRGWGGRLIVVDSMAAQREVQLLLMRLRDPRPTR